MADATFAVPNFLGGEISKFAQGRFDKPDYRTSLNVCLNAMPNEIGPWVRRTGSVHCSPTRGGAPGRVLRFDFEQSSPISLELTDSRLRFRTGQLLIPANDGRSISAISTADPAVFTTSIPHGWSTGNTMLFFSGPIPVTLQNRQFILTVTAADSFTLVDALTGLPIQGSSIPDPVTGAIVARVHELVTPYAGGSWAAVRMVQAGTTAILLNGAVAPQALTIATFPSAIANAAFKLSPAVLLDGPYMDPFINGAQVTPSAKSGIITLTLVFPTYDATKAYAAGTFVTSAGVNYVSLLDQNVGNAPIGLLPWWQATAASAAINEGRGFLASDAGRAVRLLSEPPAWVAATSYLASTAAIPVVVSYNPTGLPGGTLYYQAAVASTGKVPGTDTTNWTLIPQGAAIWTWGRITGLSNIIDRALAGSASIGDMTAGGGLAAAFDGVFTQVAGAGAEAATSGVTAAQVTLSSFVGKDYSGATAQKIQQAAVYPSSDNGFAGGSNVAVSSITLNLRAKATAPASASDGTLLGSSGPFSNTFSAIGIPSNDVTTAWNFVWIEQITVVTPVAGGGAPGPVIYSFANCIAEVSFFNPLGTGTGAGCSIEILGPPLLYTNTILTWRLGAFSDTTGWPTCGTYDDGRLWVAGAVKNRFDGSVSNGVVGGTVNFAPTDQFGAVAANNAIAYTLNAKDTNQIVGMIAEEAGLIVLTAAGEWLVRAPTTGAIAPNNISARRVSKIGAASIEPSRTEHTNIFVQRYRRKLTEFFPDAYSGKFTGPNLADKAEHLVHANIAEIAYTFAATPIIWGRCDDGSLFGVSYKRDTLTTSQPPTFAGFHRHTLGSGRTVRSICAGPSQFGNLDTLTMVTRDETTGVHHVELLTDPTNEDTVLAGHWLLDNAISPSSTNAIPVGDGYPYGGIKLNGLWHLNGKTVQVFAAGLDLGDRGRGSLGFTDFVVSNGSLSVPFGDSIDAGSGRGLFTADFFNAIPLTQVIVGFTYTSDGQLVRPIAPADSGARNGPAFAKIQRDHRYGMLLVGTLGLKVGTAFDGLRPALFRTPGGATLNPLTTFTGIHQDTLEDDYSFDRAPCWRAERPLPANVVAVASNLSTQDQ